MKRSLYLLFAISLGFLAPMRSFGQLQLPGMIDEEDTPAAPDSSTPPQRIGVPPVEVDLSEGGEASIAGYCFDEYLIAPRRVTRFENVLAGDKDAIVRYASGRTSTLRDAIARGDIDVRAVQLNVTLKNRSKEDLSVDLVRPAVFWDRQAGAVNPQALAVLESDAGYNQRQNMVWRVTTSERLLGILGYDDGSRWDYDHNRLAAATHAFQQANGLETSGELDGSTMERLASVSHDIQKRLGALGFRDREGKSLKEDLAAQIRSYQRYLGEKTTGRWSGELNERLTSDARTIPQVRALAPGGKTIAEVLAGDNTSNVLTYLYGTRDLAVLTSTPTGVELWSRSSRALKFKGRNGDAVKQMDELATQLAALGTKDDHVVIYPRVADNGTATVMIGKQGVEVPQGDLVAYVNGGEIPKPLADALKPLIPAGSDDLTGRIVAPKLVVYRGPFVQGRSADDKTLLASLGVEQVDGRSLARALDRTYGDRASVYVSDDLRAGARSIRSNMGSLDTARSAEPRFALAR